jgi:hypothetical protein
LSGLGELRLELGNVTIGDRREPHQLGVASGKAVIRNSQIKILLLEPVNLGLQIVD